MPLPETWSCAWSTAECKGLPHGSNSFMVRISVPKRSTRLCWPVRPYPTCCGTSAVGPAPTPATHTQLFLCIRSIDSLLKVYQNLLFALHLGRTPDAVVPRAVRPAPHRPHVHVDIHRRVEEIRLLRVHCPVLALQKNQPLWQFSNAVDVRCLQPSVRCSLCSRSVESVVYFEMHKHLCQGMRSMCKARLEAEHRQTARNRNQDGESNLLTCRNISCTAVSAM